MLGGSRHDATGHVLAGSERLVALQAYLAAHPGSRRDIGPETPVIVFEKIGP